MSVYVGACGVQKTVLDLLGLMLQAIVSGLTWVLGAKFQFSERVESNRSYRAVSLVLPNQFYVTGQFLITGRESWKKMASMEGGWELIFLTAGVCMWWGEAERAGGRGRKRGSKQKQNTTVRSSELSKASLEWHTFSTCSHLPNFPIQYYQLETNCSSAWAYGGNFAFKPSY